MNLNSISDLIGEQIKRRPEIKVQDIYKLLYQGVFGVGHIISDRSWDILVEEANRINKNEYAADPLIESVSPDGVFIRVNLRQFLSLGYSLRSLYKVMIRSAKYKGDIEVFQTYWKTFTDLVKKGYLNFPLDEIKRLDALIEKDGVTPQHHSEKYRIAYYPAYRVVLREVFMEDMGISE